MPAVVTTGQSITHFPEPPSKRSAKLTGYMAVMDHISEGFSEQISLQRRLQLTEGLHLKDDNWNFVSVDNSEQGTWPTVKGKLIVVGDCKHTPKEIEILPGTLDNNPGKFVLWLRCTHPPTFLPKGQTVAQIIPTWEHLEEDNIPIACPVHNITEVKPQVGWFELQEDKVQRMPPWRYLGLEIGKRTIVPQKLEIKAKIQTLADVHQLCGALNWMWLRFARLGPETYPCYLATLQWREGEDKVGVLVNKLRIYEDTVTASFRTHVSSVETRLAEQVQSLIEEGHQKLKKELKEEIYHISPEPTRVSAIRSRHLPARERGYTPRGNLWSFLREHGEDMRKWDGKPTSSLAARVHELKRETPTTRSSSRVNAAPVSQAQNSRQYRKDDMTDPLEGTSGTYLQEKSNVYHDQE
ncbi:hypothetical protein DUI87_03507 [Hirundo rustica rustica]|uniref:Uncharacterized protein n=1 Tax=Hirundo rustica rustica TaxID=333673 RepID=A0A3M0LAB0_HIRRU|nr:hypothetical protein DUI87_03507 [Hirundo rustica rustica]